MFDTDACRTWLADEHRVHDMSTTNLTMAAGVDRLLEALDQRYGAPRTLTPGPGRYRTADGDGPAGGIVITIDLTVHKLRLATDHHGYDQLTDDAATTGTDAAVEALGTVARLVNAELATLTAITGAGRHHP